MYAGQGDFGNRFSGIFAIFGVIKGPFHVFDIGRYHQALACLLFCQACEFGHAVQRQVQLRGIAAVAEMLDFAYQAGLDVPGSEQFEQGCFRVGIGNHGCGHDFLTAVQFNAPGFSIFNQYPGYAAGCPDIGAVTFRGIGNGPGDGAHATNRLGGAAATAVPVQRAKYTVVGARPEERAEHAFKAQRTPDHRVLKIFVQDIVDVNSGNAHKLAHIASAKATNAPCRSCQSEEITWVISADSRRHPVVQATENAGKAFHEAVVLNHGLPVFVGHTISGHAVSGKYQVPATVRQRDRGHSFAGHLQAMGVEFQFTADFPVQHIEQVSNG